MPLLLPHHKPLATRSHYCFNTLEGSVGTRTCPTHLLPPVRSQAQWALGEADQASERQKLSSPKQRGWVTACPSATPIWPMDVLCSACIVFSNPFNELATSEKLESSTLKFTCQASASEQSAKTQSLSPKKEKMPNKPQFIIFLETIRDRRLPCIQVA